jgi:hypothetical protein
MCHLPDHAYLPHISKHYAFLVVLVSLVYLTHLATSFDALVLLFSNLFVCLLSVLSVLSVRHLFCWLPAAVICSSFVHPFIHSFIHFGIFRCCVFLSHEVILGLCACICSNESVVCQMLTCSRWRKWLVWRVNNQRKSSYTSVLHASPNACCICICICICKCVVCLWCAYLCFFVFVFALWCVCHWLINHVIQQRCVEETETRCLKDLRQSLCVCSDVTCCQAIFTLCDYPLLLLVRFQHVQS